MSQHGCPMCGYRPEAPGAEEAKLPLRYRKAYRFLIANLREPDLSVNDLAQAAGVTERAIQYTWKRHLSCSPKDTIRRLRAERIRREIVTSNKTLLQCGEQFGIYSRSTLLVLFEDVFGCAPGAFRGPSIPVEAQS